MNEFVKQVTDFQKKFDPDNLSYNPKRLEHLGWPKNKQLLKLRSALIAEEAGELLEAVEGLELCLAEIRSQHLSVPVWCSKSDNHEKLWRSYKREFIDALGDILVVVIGTALAFGFDIEEIMRRIYKSNMSKLDKDGKPIYRSDGKVLKGPNYKPPVLDDLV